TFKRHRKWGSRDRRVFAESVYECVRWWRWFWFLAGLPDEEHNTPEHITPERIWRVWAAYWIMQDRELPRDESAPVVRVDEVRQRARQNVSPALRASIPDWMDARCASELGLQWPALRDAMNMPAEVFMRVNTLKADRRTVREKLAEAGFAAEAVEEVPSALKLVQRQNVFGTPAYKEGLFEVQDAASQLIAPFLEVAPGMKVIDACAGGGGKALHLAAMMRNKGKILALDIHAWKLAELRKRAARAGVDIIEAREIEGTKTVKRLLAHADRVLLDVPCSGLGVLRRNPDAKWKLSAEEIDRLTALQADILENYSRMVKPGGKLVYATCSILPSENERQVQQFLLRHGGEWQIEDELRRTPAQGSFDGFYAARLVKITAKVSNEPDALPLAA
ncbi:MAG: RsmB/NOP family class I SAM-dependent RNA methyltransferase, partial [Verrucomicrobiaceae bacterium]|nr:RsmB/NOP family class I SAM-dependent RNA methyltransferase [Verrucomicrobiaceae bacterium]